MKNREMYKDKIMKALKDAPVEDGAICDFIREVVFPTQRDNFTGKEYCGRISCNDCSIVFAFWLDEEYVEPKPEVDWNKVPVDTLVRVRDNEKQPWSLRHFRGFFEYDEYKYATWLGGTTSKTADGCSANWRYCELVEEEIDQLLKGGDAIDH